jgi:hypothetical protein
VPKYTWMPPLTVTECPDESSSSLGCIAQGEIAAAEETSAPTVFG